jgi:20S proteasome alpha/beta subunit
VVNVGQEGEEERAAKQRHRTEHVDVGEAIPIGNAASYVVKYLYRIKKGNRIIGFFPLLGGVRAPYFNYLGAA